MFIINVSITNLKLAYTYTNTHIYINYEYTVYTISHICGTELSGFVIFFKPGSQILP